jgi:exodeoxyribonuclease VII small subunit
MESPMAAKKSESFEKKLNRLEAIVEQLEGESLDLEKAVALFEEGIKLTKECNKILTDAEKKVEILLKDTGGNLTANEFDPGLDEEEPEE